MGGTKRYGILTQTQINRKNMGSGQFTPEVGLTDRAAELALERGVESKNLRVSNAEAARIAVDVLKHAGYKNVRTVRTQITDGTVYYKVVSNNKGNYGVVDSKDRKKKKK